ncbi:hypothetical protein V3W47_13390 [Deinococcus sp. YIM 134068]|uniref:hypothetical protein n=1 Tax=Deinococcus lichenicola TaxID=3118910 RepID=UPI002F95303C
MRGLMDAVVGTLLLGASATAQQVCEGQAGVPTWAESGVFRGSVGGLPVALALGKGEDGEEARYFYERRGVNIALVPGWTGDTLLLREEVWSVAEGRRRVTGCLRLRRAGAALSGTWTGPDGRRTLPVALAPLDVTRLPLNLPSSPGLRRLRASDPLTFLKLNRAWVREAGGVREPLSGVSYPRISNGSAALNAALQDRQLEHAANALTCTSDLGQPPGRESGDGYTLTARVTWQGRRLVSLFETASYSCGGVHPDAYDVGLILDRATGREVPVTALWPGLTPARLSALSLAHGRADGICRDVLTDREPKFTAHLTGKGLALTPSGLPHVAFACAETVTLPYSALRPAANVRGPYFRDLYPR